MNDALQKTFEMNEVEEALMQMSPLKLPCPDGYKACFYHAYWSTVGGKVSDAFLKFLNGE